MCLLVGSSRFRIRRLFYLSMMHYLYSSLNGVAIVGFLNNFFVSVRSSFFLSGELGLSCDYVVLPVASHTTDEVKMQLSHKVDSTSVGSDLQ